MEPETKQGRLAIIRRLSRKRRQLVVVELVQDFAQNSTLHGLRYVAERGVSHAERVFWIAAFVTSLSLCAMLISNVWVKWQTSPIIVTLSEQLVSVGEVPFPAVTICPQSKVKQSVFNDSSKVKLEKALRQQFDRNWTQNDIDRLNMYNAVGLLCGFTDYFEEGNDSDAKLIERLYEVSPDINDVFEWCKKHGRYYLCDDLFSPVLTKEGVCFTMNTLAAEEIFRVGNVKSHDYYLDTSTTSKGWSFLKGYYSTNDSDVYPDRGRSKGDEPYLVITLTEQVERSIQCNIFEDGFKVYLHHPADMPQTSVYYFSTLPGEAVSLAVKLSVLNTSSNLKDYPPEKRQCYFPEERQLRYFLTYTTRNCMLECQTNFTLEVCDCVEFYMPHSMNSAICKGLDCVLWARGHYANNDGLSQCQCLPLCNDIHYEAEILKSKFNISRFVEQLTLKYFDIVGNQNASLFENVRFTKLLLYYKAPQFISMRRSEMFGLTDFLANCGGLLGLFLGFSFLSLVEIFYFLTLRLGCALRRDQEHPDNVTAKK